MDFSNIVKVFNKNRDLIAIFTGNAEGSSESAMMDMMVSPTIKLQSGEIATFSFQILADSSKWEQIKNPENLYHVNDRWFTPLSDAAYTYEDNNDVSVVSVVCVEIESLLSRQFHQAYNCSIYTQAKAYFNRYVNDGAEFIIYSTLCSSIGNVISTANAWEQVKNWTPKDDDGNQITYAILSGDDTKPTAWKDYPSGVFFKSFTVSGNTAIVVIESRAKINVSKVFPYSANGQYNLGETPIPSTVTSVKVNSTVTTKKTDTLGPGTENETHVEYATNVSTSDKEVYNYSYNPNNGVLTLNYQKAANEDVNAITITYTRNDLGEITPGSLCTFAYGAEAIDEHTFVVLPKAKTKYKLTIDGVAYNDSDVKDSRGVVMPRGSGGYAMWAALKGTGWTLGICDVLAIGFDASIDYGCFNVESDMKDTLSNIRYIQQLYGGILDWDSENKVLNYRAENYDHYQAYKDGFNEWKGYVFREGKNMTAPPVITYDNNIITRAYLLGYGNLNVRKVNGGKTYVEDFSYTKDIYEGYLKQELIYDTRDEGGQKQLLYWGEKELAKQCHPRKNVQLSVTDLRTVEGLEHEVFDINDIVKVYYHDESTDTDVVEEQRVVMWEYNAFAMWDCTVELGDKTVNEVELFKLIYNKSLASPAPNGSGNLSSSDITIEGGGGGDIWNPNSLTNHIELIARTTTDNSDAIAGLILDTSAYHAQVDLFAYYQKQTDKLFTEAYAGMKAYTDGKGAYIDLCAQYYAKDAQKNAEEYAEAQIKITADNLKSEIESNTTYIKKVEDGLTSAMTQIKQLSDDTKSMIDAWTEFYEETGDGTWTWAKTQITQISTDMYSEIGIISSFKSSIEKNGKDIEKLNQAGFITYADAKSAAADVIVQQINNGQTTSYASISAYVDDKVSKIQLTAIKDSFASLYLDGRGVIECSAGASINLSSAYSINLQSSYISIGQDHDAAVYIRGLVCKKVWTRVLDSSGNPITIFYFGGEGNGDGWYEWRG